MRMGLPASGEANPKRLMTPLELSQSLLQKVHTQNDVSRLSTSLLQLSHNGVLHVQRVQTVQTSRQENRSNALGSIDLLSTKLARLRSAFDSISQTRVVRFRIRLGLLSAVFEQSPSKFPTMFHFCLHSDSGSWLRWLVR